MIILLPSLVLRVRRSQKLLLVRKLTCKNYNGIFVKKTDTSGHSVVWAIYTSHTDQFTLKPAAFEYLAACLSVIFELLPGLIPFASLWHTR